MPCYLRASFASRTVATIATQMGLERYFRWRPLSTLPCNVKGLVPLVKDPSEKPMRRIYLFRKQIHQATLGNGSNLGIFFAPKLGFYPRPILIIHP
jgi:hypothetical protein